MKHEMNEITRISTYSTLLAKYSDVCGYWAKNPFDHEEQFLFRLFS